MPVEHGQDFFELFSFNCINFIGIGNTEYVLCVKADI